MRSFLPPLAATAILLAVVFAVPTPATAHGVFEANELEIHVVNDEGSDAIEPYGGYDITEIFVGFAHDPAVGAGAAGDGFYVRLELYGDRSEAAVPALDAKWSVSVAFDIAGKRLVRELATTDGTTFTGDFDTLLVDVEGRDTHVLRAFVGYDKAGITPGQAAKFLVAESRVDGDLRDVAPGGIPVPGTNGAASYPEPTSIPGKGILVESFALAAPDGYVRLALSSPVAWTYEVRVESALSNGGQHILLLPLAATGWDVRFEGPSAVSVEANGTATFRFTAQGQNATGPLGLELTTDVGGRIGLILGLDGSLLASNGVGVAGGPPPMVTSPPFGWLQTAGALLGAALVGRRAVPQSGRR